MMASASVREKLRALVERSTSSDQEKGMQGGFNSCGVAVPTALDASAGTKGGAGEQVAFQTKVPSLISNSADLSAQAVVSADRRYVRVSLSPVFQTVNRLQSGPVVNNPFIPGGN